MAVKKAKSSGNPVRDELFRLMKEGKLPQVRALKMKCTDWIIDHIYPDFDWDDVPSNVVNIFAGFTLGLTYGNELIEKN